jgi:hypothetical protein
MNRQLKQWYKFLPLAVLLYGAWAVPATATVTQISAGQWHTCALKSDGSAVCWGDNDYLQSSPADGPFKELSAGYRHSCGVRTDGNIVCWGASSDSATPTGGPFVSVGAANGDSCGVRQDGKLVCTKASQNMDDALFSSVEGGVYFGQQDNYSHICGIKTDGSIGCSGSYPSPVPASSLTFKQISLGNEHACGVRTSGALVCWGRNSSNQTTAQSGTFLHVAAGGEHSCAVKTDGSVTCWGDNSDRQSVPPSGTFTQVVAGSSHSCGLKTDGTVVCWGSNSAGQTTLPSDLNTGTVTPPPPSTTYTQAQLDAAVTAAKQACATNPASCGITGSGGLTQAEVDTAVASAKQTCINNPASCGIATGVPMAYFDELTFSIQIPAFYLWNEIYQASLVFDGSIPGKLLFDLVSLSKNGEIVVGMPATPTFTGVQVSANSVQRGDTLSLTWQSNYQDWYFVHLYSENSDTPINTEQFLSTKCKASQLQTGVDTASQGCLWQEHGTAAAKNQSWIWTVPSQLPVGQYRLKVAIWNSAGQSAGGFSTPFSVR